MSAPEEPKTYDFRTPTPGAKPVEYKPLTVQDPQKASGFLYVMAVAFPIAGLIASIVYFARNAPSQGAALLLASGLGVVATFLLIDFGIL
jgi:hypothetical protein